MNKQLSMAKMATMSLMTAGDLTGVLYGTKHKGSKKSITDKVSNNRKKEKAARKARAKNR